MRPAPFDYLAPASVEEACAALSEDPDTSCVLAGGQSLLPLLCRRLTRPRRLIDITKINGLQCSSATEDRWHIGAAVTQRTGELSPQLDGFGVLAQALPRVGNLTTRNRGTICGSIAHADPAAELGVCLLALGGEVTAVSTRGQRRIAADDIFCAPYQTALSCDEFIGAVTFNRPPTGSLGYFDEVTVRGTGDTPLVSAAVTARVDNDQLTQLRIVVGGAGQIPVLAPSAHTLAERLDDAAIEDASSAFASELQFCGDARGSGQHRRRLAARLVARLLRRLKTDLL